MRDLNQKVRVSLEDLVIVDLLSRKDLFGPLFRVVCTAPLELILDHVNYALEPLCEKNSVLPTTWFA